MATWVSPISFPLPLCLYPFPSILTDSTGGLRQQVEGTRLLVPEDVWRRGHLFFLRLLIRTRQGLDGQLRSGGGFDRGLASCLLPGPDPLGVGLRPLLEIFGERDLEPKPHQDVPEAHAGIASLSSKFLSYPLT